jgi:4-hydroxythreonine-4-phosphate dehydrogenase
MMLAGPRLRVALATTHLALRDIPAALSPERIHVAARLTDVFLRRDLGIPSPRLGILAINPHAGDNGRFGNEDNSIVAPVVARLASLGIDARGPIPADTAFRRAWDGEFDALVAMYHDQGLGPLKLVHFHDAINITLGLPRPRCSPDHGPAYDLAAGGRADPTSMTEALRFALAIRDGHTSPIRP